MMGMENGGRLKLLTVGFVGKKMSHHQYTDELLKKKRIW